MKKLFSLLLAVILILPMGACAEGGGTMANWLYNGVELPEFPTDFGEYSDSYTYRVIIWAENQQTWFAMASSAKFVVTTNDGGLPGLFAKGHGAYYCRAGETAWSYSNNYTYSSFCATFGNESSDYLVWTNHAIINQVDGTIYLAASDPVPVSAPAMYLYNGVELPALPEWDKETYPYAVIVSYVYEDGRFNLVCGKSAFVAHNETEFKTIDGNHSYCCILGDTEWRSNGESERPYYIGGQSEPVVWTNTDILNEDGTVYLEASIPILADSKLSVSVKTAAEGKVFYGNTELPPLPEMTEEQKRQYPYLLLREIGANYQILALSKVEYANVVYQGWIISHDSEFLMLAYSDTSNKWTTDEWMLINEENRLPIAGDSTQYSSVDWANFDVLREDGTVYLHASEPSAYGADFTCKELLSTDKVYRIKAWCYPYGMDFWTAPVTWESDLFSGPTHSESVTFAGLLPGTEYEVYACIYGIEGATEHNATAMFTTAASEEETLEAVVLCNQVTENSFVAWLLALGLDSGKEYTAVFEALENDETSAGSKTVIVSGSSVSQSCAFTGLKPNTDYVVYVDLYTEDRLVFSGEYEVTTLEGEIPGGYDRDSFLLGFASGLGCTAATKDGAEYNSWAQGYIVGSALRKAL